MSITSFLKDTKTELKHVNWPSQRETVTYTIIVILIAVFVAYFLGVFDFIFSRGLEKIIF